MYNRNKIIQTLRDIHNESKVIAPYVVVAQPRRKQEEIPAQSFQGQGKTHIDLMGHSHGYVECIGEVVDVARNYLIEQAIDSGAKYLFFIGDDTVVPWDAFQILRKTAEENPDAVVTGVYYMKCSGPMIMIRTEDSQIAIPNVDPGQVIESWQTGMDCMLIPISILKSMKEQEPELPFCVIANKIEDIPFVGEDNFFVYRLRKAGFRLLTNTDVQCLHMDMATGKYTAHPSVDLRKYYTNVKPTGVLTLEDKAFIDNRWASRAPVGTGVQASKEAKAWLPGEDIPNLIKHIKNPVGIEIGTAEGYTTTYLLKEIEDLTLIGIDPYADYLDWNGNFISNSELGYQQLLDKTADFGDRYNHIRLSSDEAVELIEDNSLDFIFIDGLHTYEQVLKDCKNYYPKLKAGGIFIGHDYNAIEDVNKAVTEFANTVGKPVATANQDLWYWAK
jgi:predicted O-methyltransferase YrrM